MHDDRSHPLLAQLPLTVSPFLSLPTQTTLPYTYKSLPSTLPQSCIDPLPPPGAVSGTPDPNTTSSSEMPPQKAQYVISESTGHAAHPDDIIASCQALQAHLEKLQRESREMVERWTNGMKERDLAEKRRVAPGWLDVGEENRLLVPERKGTAAGAEAQDRGIRGYDSGGGVGDVVSGVQRLELDGGGTSSAREGEELDRAFGGL
ncbi:hypothetical protein NA57DRAFT_78621 [Rhizodiscina lignyota]|uniref:Uncharacterized protein n=1 Tax=Rhizodiscina lignyota TaxID=1504668 RepID=A0A9P4M7H8_9PEZI|nr:hypothetical protein NA57DRAFT_78621 [Rhizodiscina lignyota]